MNDTTTTEFWKEIPDVLAQTAQLDDERAADTLVDFLEQYRHVWPSIAASMQASAARRALFVLAVRVLAEKDLVDDDTPF
jgi:hypothetical protein